MSTEKKTVNWLKVAKVVGEFLVALVTALFASNFCLPLFT